MVPLLAVYPMHHGVHTYALNTVLKLQVPETWVDTDCGRSLGFGLLFEVLCSEHCVLCNGLFKTSANFCKLFDGTVYHESC